MLIHPSRTIANRISEHVLDNHFRYIPTMRYTATLFSTLSLLAGIVSPAVAQSAAQTPVSVECTQSSGFEGFLNALLTTLHYSGNSAFEEVVAEWSETEAGYEVLEGVFTAVSGQEKWTMLVPTDGVSFSTSIELVRD